MNENDRAVLGLLVNSDIYLTPMLIDINLNAQGTEISRRTVHRCLNRLQESGYVERVDSLGVYASTDMGLAKLNGEAPSMVQ